MRPVRATRRKPRVIFPRSAMQDFTASMGAASSSSQPSGAFIEELLNDDFDAEANAALPTAPNRPDVPSRFLTLPSVSDSAPATESSIAQDEAVAQCLPFLAGTEAEQGEFNAAGVPQLRRREHARFLRNVLGPYPAGYVGYDASRPWLLYWALTGLSLLGEDVAPYRERVVQNLAAAQNPDGGYGGGHGQMSHCATSYAAVLSLAMVGGAEALDSIDRRGM